MPKTTDDNEPPQFLTVGDVAKRLQVTKRTVWKWISNDELRVHRFGGAVRIAPEDLDDFIKKRRQ